MIGLLVQTAEPARALGVSESLRLADLPEAWVIALVLLPLVLLVSWAAYAREPLSGTLRVVLSGLRFLALTLVLLVLFRPVLVERNEEVRPAEVLVLLDDSASMQRQDAYLGDETSRTALAPLVAGPLQDSSRIDLARAAVEARLLPHLEQGDYEPRLVRFAERATPLSDLAELSGRGRGTHLGDALQEALALARGRHVTDVVLVSDGRSNGGTSPLDAARASGAAGIPVHTVVVGDARPERNVRVELVEVPEEVLEGDEIALAVRVAGRGLEPGTEARVLLEELLPDGSARLVAEESAVPDEGGELERFLAPAEAPRPGEPVRRFRVSVQPVPEETLLDDNQVEVSVRVDPAQIRVLYIDGYPRWEYRFLKELLKRADENISVQLYLLSATPDFLQEHSPGLPSLSEVPTDRKTLLENYDVILLGDVNPDAISPDPARCEEFRASLLEFVERGGGVLFLAGEYENPRSFLDTELEDLMPVVLDSTSGLPYQGDTSLEFKPTLEEPSQPHPIVRLHPDLELNRVLWEEPRGLRGHYWYSAVGRARPGSQVLLRHPTESGPHGRHPLLVTGYYPSGRTLFLALDSTWMWRYRFGDRYHGRFWRNAIRWLALGRLKSGDRRYTLDSLRARYGLDERVTLEARVLDEDFRPSDRAQQELVVEDESGERRELDAALVPGREGVYRTSFEAGRPGLYRAWIEVGGEAIAETEFEVLLPSRENADPTPDPAAMASMASLSDGRAVTLGTLEELLAELPGGEERREPISSRLDDAWDTPWTLVALLLLLGSEWVLRKRNQLV